MASGKRVKTSILHGQVEQAVGNVDDEGARLGVALGDEAQRDQPAAVEHQEVAGRVGLDRLRRCPGSCR